MRLVAAVAALAIGIPGLLAAPTAEASPPGQGISLGPPRVPAPLAPVCAHRGAEHAAQHHETRESDSRWHERHGDLPTCNLNRPDDVDDHDHEHDDPRWFPHDDHRDTDVHQDHEIPRRDHEGFHCTWRGCG